MITLATRGLCLVLGLGLLAATACSSKKAATNTQSQPSVTDTATSSAPSPTATTAAPTQAASPATSASPTRKASPTPTKSATAAPTAAAPTKPAGQTVNQPKLGSYTYALSGSAQSPVLGLPQSYPAGAVLTVEYFEKNPQGGGTEYGSKAYTQQDQATTTAKNLWLADKVLLLSSNLTFTGVASYDCVYSPSPELLPIPLVAGTIPTQSWSGSQCSGTLSSTVIGAEKVTAAGRSWDVWRIHTIVHFQAQSALDATVDTTSLFSPELGTVITSDETTNGTVSGQAFSNHQVTTLTVHP